MLAGPEGIRWGLMVQTALFVIAGIHVLALACSDTFRQRDAGSLLLMLWILGTFVFTSFLNWSTNARTVLPMVPAAGILVGRRLERMSDSAGNCSSLLMSVPLIASACLALAVSWADFSLASCQRSAATEVMRALRDCTRPVWFQGHWGFQYYMEAHNCRPVDLRNSRIEQGDVVVVPSNNANVAELAKDWFHLVERTRCRPFSWLGTVQKNLGAGFYSDRWGPLPFAVGRVQPEEYRVFLAGAYEDPAAAVREFRAECLR